MGLSSHDVVLCVACTTVVVMQVLVFLRSAVYGGWCSWVRRLALAARRCDVSSSHKGGEPQNGDKILTARVARRVGAYMSENAQRMWFLLGGLNSVALLFSLGHIVVDASIPSFFWDHIGEMIVLSADLMIVLLCLCPCLSEGCWLSLWYSVSGCVFTAWVITAGELTATSPARRTLFFLRLCWALIYPHAGWGLLWNAIYTCSVMYTSGLSSIDLLEGISIVFIMHTISRSHWARARHEVRETCCRVESDAMLSLLNLVCDVVVELDSTHRIVEHVPRFAAMLALPAFKATQGMRLQDFMPCETDREALNAHLGMSEGGAGTGALHVRLRDSMNMHISCEIFYVQFTGQDNRTHHFAGIREFSEYQCNELPVLAPVRAAGAARKAPSAAEAPPGRNSRGATEFGKGTSAVAHSRSLQDGSSSACPPDEQVPRAPSIGEGEVRTVVSCDSSDVASAQGSARLQFQPTGDVGKEATVVEAMSRWFVPRAGRCCAFHAALSQLQGCLSHLEASPCREGFGHHGDAQCMQCGVVATKLARTQACTICGHQVRCRCLPKDRL